MSLYATTVLGYRLTHRACNAAPGYIPSLIGINPKAGPNPATTMYFEAHEEEFHLLKIGEIILTPWVVEDTAGRNRILQCRYEKGTFYVPEHELLAEAEKDGNGGGVVTRVVNLTGGNH